MDGGPEVHGPPDGEGFDSILARRIITSQLGGRLANNWEHDGLAVHLSVPVERLAG